MTDAFEPCLKAFGPLISLIDPVVADPVAQDNDKRNNIQIYTEILH